MLDITHFTDPGCPWAYSASPALTALRWRYSDGLRWTLVTIGLTEDAAQYEAFGLTPTRIAALTATSFRRFGMPFQITPKVRMAATSPACRAVIATRQTAPVHEMAVFRALQFAQFTTTAVLDDPQTMRAALATVDGIDADDVVARIDDPEVVAAYEQDRARARRAQDSPTEFQGRSANSDGLVRYTAPSLIFRTADGQSLEAGGFQPLEAYDVIVANLDRTLERTPPASDPVDVLAAFDHPLASAEVAAVMTEHLGVPDLPRAEEGLIAATGDGRVRRLPAGDGSLWQLAG